MLRRLRDGARWAGATVLIGLAGPPAHAAPPETIVWETSGQAVKPFRLKGLEGRMLDSKDLAGKVVVVDFWATWCGPCVKELPELAAFHARVKDRTDLVFLSLDVTDEGKALAAFVKAKKVPYPVYLGDDLLGPYEVVSFPTKLLIDMRKERPVVRYRRTGFTPLASLEAKVAELLASPR